ncbi:hypothetical protein C8R43DRAFT_1117141 [Mycena crocata]|nr:hypothetical protein C8R43DRAFT_1117141 [Mycena crocata]
MPVAPHRVVYSEARDIWLDQVKFVANTPYGPDSRRVLYTMSALELFDMAIFSSKLYWTVTRFIKFVDENDLEEEPTPEDESSDSDSDFDDLMDDETDMDDDTSDATDVGGTASSEGWTSLPIELGMQVLKDMDLGQQLKFAKTSTFSSAMVGEALQLAATAVLRPFELTFAEMRLVQTALGCVVSGSAVTYLVQSSPTFTPGDLDLFTAAQEGYYVVQYLKHGKRYALHDSVGSYASASGVRKVWTLKNVTTGAQIHVIESVTDNPFHAILRFHSTCVMGAWTDVGLWHAFPDLTDAALSITTPRQMPLRGGIRTGQRFWKVLSKYRGSRGFKFSFDEYDAIHHCGRDWNCPVTMRSTGDGGCLTAAFPTWAFSADSVQRPHLCWTLGGHGCSKGIKDTESDAPTVSVCASYVGRWADAMNLLLDMETEPTALSDYFRA